MYTTEDFIKYEFATTDVTPALCENVLAFAENNPDIDEHSYNQFRELRKEVESKFNNPYDLERIENEHGKGFSIGLSYSGEPTKLAWELLGRYFAHNGWSKFEYNQVGCYRMITTSSRVRIAEDNGNTYKIDIYHN